jgi:hypothetical protein
MTSNSLQNPVAVVQAWQKAANEQDIERLLSLSDEQIEIIGPRGSAYGHQILREWMARAGLTLDTKRIFANDTAVVVEQHGVWRDVDTKDIKGEADLGSSFRVVDGHVTRYARFDTLALALEDAELTETYEVNVKVGSQ